MRPLPQSPASPHPLLQLTLVVAAMQLDNQTLETHHPVVLAPSSNASLVAGSQVRPATGGARAAAHALVAELCSHLPRPVDLTAVPPHVAERNPRLPHARPLHKTNNAGPRPPSPRNNL